MPELPEVETIRRQLSNVLVGQTIQDIVVRREKSFPHFAEATRGRQGIIGKEIVGVGRKAKVLIIDLEDDLHLLVHLKMTGQLIYQELGIRNQELGNIQFTDHKPHFKVGGRIVGGHPTDDWVKTLPTTHTRVIITLDRGILYFNDMRVFGWIKLVDSDQWLVVSEKLPPDVIDSEFTSEYFIKQLKGVRRSIKIVLMDQAKIGGVGNIYANEALWMAGIDPRRAANSLTDQEVKRLYRAVKEVIAEGIRWGGASESTYKHINGLGGKYQEHFLVYKMQRKRCQRRGCKGVIKKITLGGRGTYFCASCQQ